MVCNRCEDIHFAQKEGLQLDICKCDCHEEKIDWKKEYQRNELFWDNKHILCNSCGSDDIVHRTEPAIGTPVICGNCGGEGHVDCNEPEDLGKPTTNFDSLPSTSGVTKQG